MRLQLILMLSFVALPPVFAISASAQQSPQRDAILFKNAKVFDGKSSELSRTQAVLIVGNKIEKIGSEIDTPTNARVIDVGGRTLMPGLIDNHVHLFMNGSTQEEMLGSFENPEKLHEVAALQAEKMLMRGFTTVRDVGGPVFDVKKWIDQGKSVGPRIYPSGAIISQTSGHGDTRLPNENLRSQFYRGWASRRTDCGARESSFWRQPDQDHGRRRCGNDLRPARCNSIHSR
jgi:imidazolonepropionase-like amidohydrolase